MKRSTLLLLTVGLVSPLSAGAQSTEPADTVFELEPIRVRVLRSLVGTGAPISMVAGAELVRGRSGAFLEEALRALPGIQIQNRFNLASGERLMIRGFGSRAQFGIRGVRVLVDGIPATLPDGQTAIDHVDIGGLGQVWLLRGPASALYGNAAGGVLYLQSVRPRSGRPTATFNATAGSHQLRTLRGSIAGPLGAGDYRFAIQRFSFDGFRRDPVADDDSNYGGAERTVVNASVGIPVGGGELRFIANGLDMDARNAGSLSTGLLDEGDRQAYRFNVLQRTRELVRQGQAGATWTGPVGGLDAEISTWGIHREVDGPIPPRVIELNRNAGGVRALFEGVRRTGGGHLSVAGGLEVELQSDKRRNWDNDGGEKGPLELDQQERVRATGIFGQVRLDVSAAFALSAGVRYDRFRFEAEDHLVSSGNPDDSGTRIMAAVSPSVGAVLKVAVGFEAFASASRSFETPTTTELVNRPTGSGGFNPELDPQHGTTVEGGLRGSLAHGWSLEATLFQTTLTDELVPFEVPSSPGRTFFRNAGSSRHRGWEMAMAGAPTQGVSLRVAYTRVDARFTDFTVDGDDYSGNRIPGLSPWRVDGRIVLERGRAFVMLRGLFEDDIPVNNANSEASAGYFLGDIRVGVDDMDGGRFTLSPFAAVTNVLDRRYNAAVVVNAFGGRFYEPGPPRSFQVGLGVRWGG